MVLILPHMNNLSAHTAGNFEKGGGVNHVPLTTITPQKEYWPSWGSNQHPLFSSPVSYRLRYCGLAGEDTVLHLQTNNQPNLSHSINFSVGGFNEQIHFYQLSFKINRHHLHSMMNVLTKFQNPSYIKVHLYIFQTRCKQDRPRLPH